MMVEDVVANPDQSRAVLPFFFVIPLLAKQCAADWISAADRAHATIRNCLSQDGENIHVVLCAHDVPELISRDFRGDSRLKLMMPPLGPPLQGGSRDSRRLDKALKQKHAILSIGETNPGPSHLMLLDGDDLVSDGFVAHVREIAPTSNVVITHGYVYDFHHQLIREHDSIDSACGSTGVFFMTPEDYPVSLLEGGIGAKSKIKSSRLYLNFLGHKLWRESFSRSGRDYVEMTERNLVYVKNHGSNITMLNDKGVVRGHATKIAPPGIHISEFQFKERFLM